MVLGGEDVDRSEQTMKPFKAWAVTSSVLRTPRIFNTRFDAGHPDHYLWPDMRIVRVEIREVPKKLCSVPGCGNKQALKGKNVAGERVYRRVCQKHARRKGACPRCGR